MAIDYSKLRSITAREFIRALHQDGFQLRSQRGSHQRYVHEDGRKVTVAFHGRGSTFAIDVLKKMVEREAQWTEEDVKRLRLLK